MKKESIKRISGEERKTQHDDRWIDVHDDDVMRAMGFLRPFNQSPRDKSVWTKTTREREALKKAKSAYKRHSHFDGHCGTAPRKTGLLRAKLIIQLKKNKEYPKTTYSYICLNTAIDDILDKFKVLNASGFRETLVSKYKFNGKEYRPDERPWINQ